MTQLQREILILFKNNLLIDSYIEIFARKNKKRRKLNNKSGINQENMRSKELKENSKFDILNLSFKMKR